NLAAEHYVRIEWIRRGVSIFFYPDWMPLPKGDLTVVSTAGDASRAALLLSTTNPIRKCIIRHHVVHLRRRLVVPGTPGLPAIESYDSALVADKKDDVRIVWINPGILVIISAGRSFERRPGFSAIGGLVGDHIRHQNAVRILWKDDWHS